MIFEEQISRKPDHYPWTQEFIEAMHLIEGSLFEGDDTRRLNTLDKSLSVILEGTYEKMLHYSHNLNGPITMLHMMGVILPILGLVILPLVVSFMEGVAWYHISLLYNVALPLGVVYIGTKILAQRPTGYGDTDVTGDDGLVTGGIHYEVGSDAVLFTEIDYDLDTEESVYRAGLGITF